MKRELEVVGKNIDQAIQNGLLQLGKSREDVDIKIIETGGLFKKAKVVLVYEVEEPKTEEPKVEEVKEDIKTEELTLEQVEPDKTENVEEVAPIQEEKIEEDVAESEQIVEETKEETSVQEKEEKIVDCSQLKERATDFLNGILNKFNINGQVSCVEQKNELHFMINGENVGKLIGYRGETLNALQYLLGSVKVAGEGRVRIYLDIENYKAKREETLVELANKMADKAEEIERNVHLDPMTAYERRIIHTALQERTLVETESTGEGEKRHVVIKFKR